MASKKKVAKKVAQKKTKKPVRKEVVKAAPQKLEITVVSQPIIPTESDLAQPIRSEDGKQLALPKTWFTDKQLMFMLQRTPSNQVYRRKGKGGQTFDYVTGSYITKALNYVFGWNWDFEIVEHGKEANHVWVLGRLVVHNADGTKSVTKSQFGRSDVKQLKAGGNVDYGNDLKAASTDALKKCASMLGFASDVYGKASYKEETGGTEPNRDYGNPSAPQAPEDRPVDLICNGVTKSGCGNDLSQPEYDYSMKMFGKPLCRDCQNKFKK